MAKPIFIFLCGSSQVGKSEIYKTFPETVEIKKENYEVIKTPMSVADIRKGFGEPSWQSLCENLEIAEKQQTAILNIYKERIYADLEKSKDNQIYLYERTPLDIAGYSFAFGLDPLPYLNAHLDIVNDIETHTLTPRVYTMFREIDYTYLYDIRNGERPPFAVRVACNDYLDKIHNSYSLSGWQFRNKDLTGILNQLKE